MNTRRVSVVLVLVLLPAGAWADRHRAGAFAAYRDAKRSALHGVGFGSDFTFHEKCQPDESDAECLAPVSLLADVSYVWGRHEGEDLKQFTIMAGPRFSHGHGRFQPFAHGLLGVVHEDLGGAGDTRLTGSFGWGVDIPLGQLGSIPLGTIDDDEKTPESKSGRSRLPEPRWAIRGQFDMFWIDAETTEWYPQISFALVFRFRFKHPE